MTTSITILVCYRNEEENILKSGFKIIKSLKKLKIKHRIIFYNDASEDNSEFIVKKKFKKNCIFFSNNTPKGIGYMFRKVINIVHTEYFAIMSGNNNYKISDYLKIFSKLKYKKDLVIHQIPNNVKSRGLVRSVVSRSFTAIMNLLLKKNIKYYTGQNLYKTKLLKNFRPKFRYSVIYVEILIYVLKKLKRENYLFVKSGFYKRTKGKTKSINLNNVSEVLKFIWQL